MILESFPLKQSLFTFIQVCHHYAHGRKPEQFRDVMEWLYGWKADDGSDRSIDPDTGRAIRLIVRQSAKSRTITANLSNLVPKIYQCAPLPRQSTTPKPSLPR
jgi:hypothetical protein